MNNEEWLKSQNKEAIADMMAHSCSYCVYHRKNIGCIADLDESCTDGIIKWLSIGCCAGIDESCTDGIAKWLEQEHIIAMDDRELWTIVAFGLRYALPRHTYAFDMVSSFILRNIQHYEDWEIKTMIDDCKNYYPSADFGGDTCDRPAVDRFKQKLIDELQERRRIMLESVGKEVMANEDK